MSTAAVAYLADLLNEQVRDFVADARRLGPLPRYGSSEWAQPPHHDLRRNASVYMAAECWRDHLSPPRIADDRRDELSTIEAVPARQAKLSSWDISAQVDWRAEAAMPTYAELQRRRGAASAPRTRWRRSGPP